MGAEAVGESHRGRRRALFAAALVLVVAGGLSLLVWRLADVLLVIFAAVLLAILLEALAQGVARILPIGHGLALTLGGVAILVALTAFSALAGPQIGEQLSELGEQLPGAVTRLEELVQRYSWGEAMLTSPPEPAKLIPSPGDLVDGLSGLFSSLVGGVVSVLIILVLGLYLAIEPRLYIEGLLMLVPPRAQNRTRQVFDALGHALRWWLLGRIASMAAVGVLTGLGLWLISMPLALALAFIAGLLSFIPMIGPILSAVPAVLIALAEAPITAVYVMIVYVVVQAIEGNLITPLIQQRTVALAPALLIAAQLLIGALFGFIGVVLATPLAVVATVLVQMLYVQDLLKSKVRVLGRHG